MVLNLIRPNQASRDIKALLGEGFQFDQTVSELNPKKINYLTLPEFEKVLALLDRKGNLAAQQLRDDLVGLSLTQLFSDSFHQKFDEEDRQNYLETRQVARKAFKPSYTNHLKEYQEITGMAVNYGVEVNKLKAALNLPIKPIDDYSLEEIEKWKKGLIMFEALMIMCDFPRDAYKQLSKVS